MSNLKNHYFLLSLTWLVLTLIVNPSGEFPLNDDWSYAKSVQTLTNTNRLEFTNWPAMTLVAQVLIGAGWCKLIGFSFTALRILTLVFGLAGVIVSYKIFRQLFGQRVALGTGMLIALNPLYFSLSNTFMTDIYFYAFMVFSIWFYIRALNENRYFSLGMATLFTLIGILIRQTAIFIPLSFLIGSSFQIRALKPITSIKLLLSFFISLTALLIANKIISESNPSYLSLNTIIHHFNFEKTAAHTFYRIGAVGHTLGLFLFPISLFLFIRYYSKIPLRTNIPAIAITLLFTLPLIREFTFFPSGNVFYNLGLGPKTLKDAYLLQTNISPKIGEILLTFLQLTSFLSGILLFYCFFSSLFAKSGSVYYKTVKLAFASMVGLFFGSFILPDFFFDRYILQIMLPVVILIFPIGTNINLQLKIQRIYPLLILTGVFTVLATHDYLAWNRARAQGVDYLKNQCHISMNSIDAGFEWNGWYQTGKINHDPAKSWWFVNDDQYLLAFGNIKGYSVKKTFSYMDYLTLSKKMIYILERSK